MKVLFLPEIEDTLFELTEILYEKGYFGFQESAVMYVFDLECDIKDTLPNRQKRPAPLYFQRYGKNMFYATFRKSKHTQWYVFFNIYEKNGELTYVVRYISNNHVVAKGL